MFLILDFAIKNNAVLDEIPIHFRERTSGISKINAFQYSFQTFLYVFNNSSFIKYVIVGFAGFFVDEKHHVKAKEVVAAIAEGKVRDAVYSDYVLDELLTLARAKKGAAVSNEILEEIANSEIKMEKVEQRHLSLAMELFKSYEKLSFTDCTTIGIMDENDITNIATFDKEFRNVPWIKVIG